MRSRAFIFVVLGVLGALAGVATFSGSNAQPPIPPKTLPPDLLKQPAPPAADVRPVAAAAPARAKPPAAMDRFRDLRTLPVVTKDMVLSAQRGMEWLNRFNQPNGRFLHGYLPALNQAMEGDHFLRQANAAFALARAARFTGDDKHTMRAGQAILTLLAETRIDPATPGLRVPSAPSMICNRLAAAGFLVMAISELPDAESDLTAKAEELCQFIRAQQQADGSLHYTDTAGEDASKADPEGVNHCPGPALCGIAMSQRAKPAAWKAELLRKAAPYYHNWFRSRPSIAFVPWMTAAFAEAFVQSKSPGHAAFVCEMNDWLCKLQYEHHDPRHPEWRGGFQTFADGKVAANAPTIDSALCAQSLADCCRMIRQMSSPDMERYDRCRNALIRAMQFLATLQYAEDSTQHFMPAHRAYLVGGFHPTHQDGNLRVDQSANAVSALIQFLTSGAERE